MTFLTDFERKYPLGSGFLVGLGIVGACLWAMPTSRPALSPYGSSQLRVSPPDGASIAIAKGEEK